MIEQCSGCGKSLGSAVQDDLFGALKKCIGCITKARTAMMLQVLPDNNDAFDAAAWDKLSEFEQSFLPSVRQQFDFKGALSEKQYQVLERIWEKHN